MTLKLREISLILGLMLVFVASFLMPPEQTPTAHAQIPNNPAFGLVAAYEDPEAVRESGAGWELITFRWDELQPDGPDQWNADPQIDDWLTVAQAQNREVVGVLIGTPAWAADGEPITGAPAGLFLPNTESGNTWASFVREAVTYYGAQGINRWVIWANQDIPPGRPDTTWTGSIDEYYQLTKVAYQVAKEANPNALVHLGGASYTDPAWFGQFMSEVVDDPTAAANNYYFDVATIHVFGSPEDVYTQTGNHYGVMSQSGIPAKPVWINHTNARPTEDPVYTGDVTFARFPNVSLEQQAAFVMQSYALGFAAGADRIAVYRLVDDFIADGDEAYGLIRQDESPRPAYTAYQIAAELMNGSVFERRVDEEAFPLVDYVRFTYPERVMHVVWARTESNATLVIPARTESATLLDINGRSWPVTPDGTGVYRVAVEGATCTDPIYNCLIGGAPWLLIEEGVPNALEDVPPPVSVEEGGTVPTPVAVTPTPPPTEAPTESTAEPTPSEAAPTEEPTPQETASPTPEAVAEVPPEDETASDAPEVTEPEPPAVDVAAIEEGLRPQGFNAALPFILMGLGALVIVAGVVYFVTDGGAPRENIEEEPAPDDLDDEDPSAAPTEEHASPEFDEVIAPTQETSRPDFDEGEEAAFDFDDEVEWDGEADDDLESDPLQGDQQ